MIIIRRIDESDQEKKFLIVVDCFNSLNGKQKDPINGNRERWLSWMVSSGKTVSIIAATLVAVVMDLVWRSLDSGAACLALPQ